MLDLSTAVLCDFAQVRDRLLFTSSGAVSRLYRQELPSPLGLMVGLVIEVPLEDAGMEHTLRAEVINRHGTVLAELQNLFRVSDEGLFPHEVQQVPLVLSITGVRARTWGTHQVRLYLDEELVRALTLYVVPAAGTQAIRPAPVAGATSVEPEAGEQAELADQPADEESPEPISDDPAADAPPAAATDDLDEQNQVEEPMPDEVQVDPDPSEVEAGYETDDDAHADAGWSDAPADAPQDPDGGEEPGDEPLIPAAYEDEAGEGTINFEFADAGASDQGRSADPGEDSPPEPGPDPERTSRFAFRYRYEDDEPSA